MKDLLLPRRGFLFQSANDNGVDTLPSDTDWTTTDDQSDPGDEGDSDSNEITPESDDGSDEPVDDEPPPGEFKHDDDLLAEAQEVGIDPDEARSLPGKALWRVIRAERNAQTAQRSVPKGEGQTAPNRLEYKAFDFAFGDDVDPAIKDKLTAYQKHQDQFVSGLVERFNAQESQLSEITTTARVQDFDSRIAALGAEYEQYLGKGSSLEMKPNSLTATARAKLAQRYMALLPHIGDKSRAFSEAVHAVFGDKQSEIQRSKVRLEADAANKRSTVRPSHNRSVSANASGKGARESAKGGIADYLARKNRGG